jgi:hypothetical protein
MVWGEGSETGRVFKGETSLLFFSSLGRKVFIYRYKILIYFGQGINVVIVTC